MKGVSDELKKVSSVEIRKKQMLRAVGRNNLLQFIILGKCPALYYLQLAKVSYGWSVHRSDSNGFVDNCP